MKNYKKIGISIGVLLMMAVSTACGNENISKNSNEEHRVLKTAETVAAAEEAKVETTESTSSTVESKAETTKAAKTEENSKAETKKDSKADENSKAEIKKDVKSDESSKAETAKPAAAPAETKTETANTFTSPAQTKAETTETRADNEVKNTKETSDYSKLLDWYYDQISTEWSGYDMQKSGYGVARSEDSDDTVSYMWYGYEKPDLTNSGYQIIDINHDGVDELVVGKKGDGDSDALYDLYTMCDGEVVRVASSGERDKFYVKDDIIHERGSGSAAVYGNTSYRLVDGKAVPFEQIMHDSDRDADNPYFYSNEPVASETGGYDFENMQHITEEEMDRMDEHETTDINLQSFCDYK